MRAQVFIISGSVYVLRYKLVYLSKIINESSLGKETILYFLNLKRFPFNLIWKYKQKSFKYWLGCYKLTFMDIAIMCRYYMQKGYNISFTHNFVNVDWTLKYSCIQRHKSAFVSMKLFWQDLTMSYFWPSCMNKLCACLTPSFPNYLLPGDVVYCGWSCVFHFLYNMCVDCRQGRTSHSLAAYVICMRIWTCI